MLKQDFDNKLKLLGLSRSDFSDLSGVSYLGTVTKWDDEKRPIPSWVESWLENFGYRLRFEKIRALLSDEDLKI